ncbi:MAG: N-acetylglucosamine-6-phosphate deacetylase [Nitrospirae bacterium]|nr:MAG: N-acetylglucosamine-6-phosphate deacetylase [Nitrospirota bacterium]
MKIVDIHTHGIGGYDTRTSDVSHILKIAELHGMHGTGEIALSVYPATIPIMRGNMELIRQAIAAQAASTVASTPDGQTAARIIGLHLEGPFVNPMKAGALNSLPFLDPDVSRLHELIDGYEDIIRIITVAPELPGAHQLIRAIVNKGIRVNMGHSDATYAEAEAGFHSGATGIAHMFNAMKGFHHREPGLAGFGLMNREVYVEIIGDPFHLHPETIRLVFAVKPADRIILVSDSVRNTHAFLQPEAVTDAHGKLLGGGLTLAEAYDYLVRTGLDKDSILKSITENPERYITP